MIPTTATRHLSLSTIFPIVQWINQLVILPVGDSLLRVIYAIVKKRTESPTTMVVDSATTSSTTATTTSSASSSVDPLMNYKIGLTVFTLYYACLVTYRFYQGYHWNLTHLFEPFAPLTNQSSAATAAGGGMGIGISIGNGSLGAMVQDVINQAKRLMGTQ